MLDQVLEVFDIKPNKPSKEDLKKFGYDGVYGITPLTEQELHLFFDTENIDEWKVLTR